MSIDNNQENEAELITLIDDEGTEHEFEIIDELENDDGYFMALVPTLSLDDRQSWCGSRSLPLHPGILFRIRLEQAVAEGGAQGRDFGIED